MILFERRASAILAAVLRARADARPFLMPANACAILPETFAAAGQPFEVVDIAEPWLEIDGDECSERLRARAGGYAGLLFIHPYGSERDPAPLFSALRSIQSDLFIIDDKCLCRPDTDGDSLSPAAGLTLYSTGHAKYADLDGGGFAHAHPATAYVAGSAPPDEPWSSYRRRAIDAAAAADEQKETLNAIYSRLLPPHIQLRPELQRWRFNIRVPNAPGLLESIFASGLFASRHYAPPADAPVASALHSEIVNLFNDRYFDSGRARHISELVLRHLETTGSPRHRHPSQRAR